MPSAQETIFDLTKKIDELHDHIKELQINGHDQEKAIESLRAEVMELKIARMAIKMAFGALGAIMALIAVSLGIWVSVGGVISG